MIIGIDASRTSFKRTTGVESYSTNLILWLTKLDPSNYRDGGKYHNQYVLYTNNKDTLEMMALPANFQIKEIKFPFFWTQLCLAWHLIFDKQKPDIFFAPSNSLPFFFMLLNKSTKKVATIHDLAFKYFPESYSFINKFYYNLSAYFTVDHTDRIITISETSKDDLVKFYQADENKIKVTYLGFVPPKVKKSDLSTNKWKAIIEKFKIDKPYLLYIGRVEHKKNSLNVVKAFYEILSRGEDIQLVLAGGRGRGSEEVESFINKYNLKDRVILTDYVSEEEKIYLLYHAKLFLFLTRYEGFGIPVLEAFSTNVPVVASQIPVFNELYGDAALLLNPYKTEEITINIIKLLKNENKQQKMIERGHEAAKNFSWEKCARETLETFYELDKNKFVGNPTGLSREYARQYKERDIGRD